jgi:hypothetical protein
MKIIYGYRVGHEFKTNDVAVNSWGWVPLINWFDTSDKASNHVKEISLSSGKTLEIQTCY